MSFISLTFLFFIIIIFNLYWLLNNKKVIYQNLLVVAASYIFYGWWDYRFLVLIAFSTITDYAIGIFLGKEKNNFRRKVLLGLSIGTNLILLCFFKYYNFFIESLVDSFSLFNYQLNITSLYIILPVGISFYTFQTMSYSIDIYNKKIKPTNDLLAFSAFVSFFPQLVAGPIERASNLLPQFLNKRTFDFNKAVDGLRQVLWGLFKKIVIADNCARFVNIIFSQPEDLSGSTILLGSIFFSFQIYGDFSGYSDIAIGISRMLGINLNRNFAYPYFSKDISEFWRKWHISLSSWFKDYVYIPLGGSRKGRFSNIRNIFIVFLVSGFWHGANWTFVMWGLIHAILFMPVLFYNKSVKNNSMVVTNNYISTITDSTKIITTFLIVSIAWIFFRSETIAQATFMVKKIFTISIFSVPYFPTIESSLAIILFIILLLVVEWLSKEKNHALEDLQHYFNRPLRWMMYSILIFIMGMFMVTEQTPFIYFQF